MRGREGEGERLYCSILVSPQPLVATMVTFDWLMVYCQAKVEWKSASTTSSRPSVMICGTLEKPLLCADSLATVIKVGNDQYSYDLLLYTHVHVRVRRM